MRQLKKGLSAKFLIYYCFLSGAADRALHRRWIYGDSGLIGLKRTANGLQFEKLIYLLFKHPDSYAEIAFTEFFPFAATAGIG